MATQFKSDFLNVISERGFIHQGTDLEGLDNRMAQGTVSAYIGFDATADSLHVGSKVPIMLLRWLQKTGHKPIVLMGGGTTKVGDPSGKDTQRKLLDDAGIAKNMDGIKQVFQKFLKFGDGATDAVMVNNDDWLKNLQYIDFLRECGRHFSVNRMLSFDSVKLRLEREQPLSFLEFNYMILQAYDFMQLGRDYGCVLQMGGSDQWGNIVNGIELARRMDDASLYGVTVPLITTASGAKMGKSEGGAIWLNNDKLPEYDYWQFWRNTEDADVGRFLKLFTELPLDEIAKLEKLQGAEINEAKKILAFEATKLCHGENAAKSAEETARKTFEQGGVGDDLPTIHVGVDVLDAGLGILNALSQAGLASSNGEARRHIQGGAVKVNDAKVDNHERTLTGGDITNDGYIKLSVGKKKHALLKP